MRWISHLLISLILYAIVSKTIVALSLDGKLIGISAGLYFIFVFLPDFIEPAEKGERHRFFFHSKRVLKACLVILLGFFVIGTITGFWIFFFPALGYTSHLLCDSITAQGLPE